MGNSTERKWLSFVHTKALHFDSCRLHLPCLSLSTILSHGPPAQHQSRALKRFERALP